MGAVLLSHLVMKIFIVEETLDLAVEKDSQCTVSGLMLCFTVIYSSMCEPVIVEYNERWIGL